MNEKFKNKSLYVYDPETGETDLVLITDLVKAFNLEKMMFNLNNKK